MVAEIARNALLKAAHTGNGDVQWLLQVEALALAVAGPPRLPKETDRTVSHGRDQH